ncbi:hypothetical protein HanRHA438_Chr09g0401141 [Helianthus annuus]|nr:hypothetical protein HanRHA438_Chr09g0401141 [Helianthus annuus]
MSVSPIVIDGYNLYVGFTNCYRDTLHWDLADNLQSTTRNRCFISLTTLPIRCFDIHNIFCSSHQVHIITISHICYICMCYHRSHSVCIYLHIKRKIHNFQFLKHLHI